MPVRSYVIQLQNGIGQAILPDHRKMVPGVQYTVDADTFSKISLGARQNIIQVVTVNSDTTTTGSFLPAQSATNFNTQLGLNTILTATGTTPITWNAAGFAAQGFDGNGATGIEPNYVGQTENNVILGPAGEKYMYVFNTDVDATAGSVLTWYDENLRIVTAKRPAYYVRQDTQGNVYVPANIDSAYPGGNALTPANVGTKQGRFAGVTVATLPSGNYGWVQIEGTCPAVAISGVVTAGATLAVATATASGKVQASQAVTVTNGYVSGSAAANNVFGTALTAGTNTTVAVDIRSWKQKKPYQRFLNKN